MKLIQWQPGVEHKRVLRLPAMTVDASVKRGIKYPMPARWVLVSPYGQIDLAPGDWIITCPSGNAYAVKAEDFEGKKSHWWPRFFK